MNSAVLPGQRARVGPALGRANARADHAEAGDPDARGRQRLGGLLPLLVAALIVVFSNRRTPTVTPEKLYVAAAVILVLALILFAAIRRLQGVPRPLRWLAVFAFICLTNLPIAMMYSVPTIEWARHAFVIICVPGFAYGAYLLNARAAKVLYWLIAVLCGTITLYYLSFWLQVHSFEAVRADYDVAFWTVVGGVFASVIASCLLYPFAMRSGRRWIVAAFVIAAAGIAATFSRTFWLIAPVGIACTTILMFRRRMMKGSRIVLLATLASVLVVVVGGELFPALSTRVDTAGLSGTQRLYESQAILTTMRSEPSTFIAGSGFGAIYQEVAVDTTSLSDGLGTNTRDFSHDFYLQLLWNVGVLGLSAWLVAIVSWFRLTGRSRSPHVMGCFAAVFAISLGSFTYHPFGDLGWDVLIGLLLGIGCRLAVAARDPEMPV